MATEAMDCWDILRFIICSLDIVFIAFTLTNRALVPYLITHTLYDYSLQSSDPFCASRHLFSTALASTTLPRLLTTENMDLWDMPPPDPFSYKSIYTFSDP